MNVRKLCGHELFDASLIHSYCFHFRVPDMEAARVKEENCADEKWGAFADDGTLAAHMVHSYFHAQVDGSLVKCGGIGGVSTLPEYRGQGAINDIFREVLRDAYTSGEVISALYPFNHAFYRQYGYEVAVYRNIYEFPPAVLSGYRFRGDVIRWNPGDSADPYLNIYNRFISGYNLAMTRDAEGMLKYIGSENIFGDRHFTYLFRENGEDLAYLTFTDIKNDAGAVLRVDECAWLDPSGFRAILGFLGRFTADYTKVQLPLPSDLDLLRIIQTADAYQVQKTSSQNFMVRAVNAKQLLTTIKKPADCDFTIEVTDSFLPENSGLYHVTAAAVELVRDAFGQADCSVPASESADSSVPASGRPDLSVPASGRSNTSVLTSELPDLSVSACALAQMALGCIRFEEALLRPDVRVFSREELLRMVFHEKPILITERF